MANPPNLDDAVRSRHEQKAITDLLCVLADEYQEKPSSEILAAIEELDAKRYQQAVIFDQYLDGIGISAVPYIPWQELRPAE